MNKASCHHSSSALSLHDQKNFDESWIVSCESSSGSLDVITLKCKCFNSQLQASLQTCHFHHVVLFDLFARRENGGCVLWRHDDRSFVDGSCGGIASCISWAYYHGFHFFTSLQLRCLPSFCNMFNVYFNRECHFLNAYIDSTVFYFEL